MTTVLTPGVDITPRVDLAQVILVLHRLYGITECKVEELAGYDDKNYHVRVLDPTRCLSNPHLTQSGAQYGPPSDFVLKITNSLDSGNGAQFEAHKEIMLLLGTRGFRVQQPLRNVRGEFHSLETFGSNQHMVRLLSYLPGQTLKSITLTNDIVYKLGAEVARLAVTLKSFAHAFYDSHRSVWMLSELNRLNSFLFVLKEEGRVEMVKRVLSEFQTKVLARLDSFEKGVIHGDVNEQNILITEDKDQSPRELFSILDFGDSQHSCLVFDLAIAITYMVLETKDLDTGAYMLAGYSKVRKLPYNELNILKTCIMARLCQSLILGLYTYQEQGSSNPYVLGTQAAGWTLLETLDKYDTHELMKRWTQIGTDLGHYDSDD